MLSDVRSFLVDSIDIERATVSGFDQATTWSLLATVPGYIRALSGTESIDYGGDNVRSTHRLVCEVTDITESDRVVSDSNTYLVRFVDRKALDGSEWLQVDLEYVGAAA